MKKVALRKESVDRNFNAGALPYDEEKSLSARRAWIEIDPAPWAQKVKPASLSARRAWIEISSHHGTYHNGKWSLSARRAWIEIRSPAAEKNILQSLSARRAWIEI